MDFQYQLLPNLTETEYETLKTDIEQRGVMVPIEYDEKGNVLDGHHRLRACAELGIKDYPSVVRSGLTEDQKKEHVLIVNLARRHMNAEQRKQAVLRVKLETAWSNRRIAELFGVSRMSVGRDLETVTFVTVDLPAATIGKDGKKRTARPKTTINKNNREKQKTLDALAKLDDDDLPDRPLDSSEIAKIANGKEYKRQREELANSFTETEPDSRWNIYHADISTWIAPREYDFIITDPPYPKDYLPLYETLAKRSSQWLKDGGLLIAMAGESYLDQIMAMMTRHMSYYWTACYLLPRQPTPLRQRNVNTSWKPLLIFNKGEYKGKIFGDVFTSERNEKSLHDWEQSESGMYSIISQICFPGQYILDPFVGSGTTGIAALKHGCLFDGFDIDLDSVNIAKGRLHDTTKA